jgi:hypothetical protein
MKKFSKILESAAKRKAMATDYFTENDINNINDILVSLKDDEEYVVYIDKFNDTKGIYKIEIQLTNEKSSHSNDYLGYISECTNDIQNTISHLRSVGKVYHRFELIQENRYFGGDYSKIYINVKITIQI